MFRSHNYLHFTEWCYFLSTFMFNGAKEQYYNHTAKCYTRLASRNAISPFNFNADSTSGLAFHDRKIKLCSNFKNVFLN